MMASGVGIDAILQSSRKLYAELVNAEGIECEWQTRGLLFVFHSRHGMDHYGETNKLLSNEMHFESYTHTSRIACKRTQGRHGPLALMQ